MRPPPPTRTFGPPVRPRARPPDGAFFFARVPLASCHVLPEVIKYPCGRASRIRIMTHDKAFFGASTVFGKYWTSHQHFDYLIDKENFRLAFGRSFRMMVYLDSAIANGPYLVRQDIEADTRATNYLIHHLADIKPELTVFITTCDMLAPDADETTPTIEKSDDPYVQNRINLYRELNLQYGRVLNVHLTEVATRLPGYSPLLTTLLNPPPGRGKLPFAPKELHQFYFPESILKDADKCIPLGISTIIPATPPLTTEEIVKIVAPKLLPRLRAPREDDPLGAPRRPIPNSQEHAPHHGYIHTREDQEEFVNFFYGPGAL